MRRDIGVNPDYLDRAFKTRVSAVDSSGRLAAVERREKRRAVRRAGDAVVEMQSGRPLKPPGGTP